MSEYGASNLNKMNKGANKTIYDKDKINLILDAGFVGYVNNTICLPMSYGRIDNTLYLHGSLKNKMLCSLIESKVMSITVTHMDTLILGRSGLYDSLNYHSVTVSGEVLKVEDAELKKNALKSIVDQENIEGRWEELCSIYEKELNTILVIGMTIDSVSVKTSDTEVEDVRADLELPIWAGIIPSEQKTEVSIHNDFLIEKMPIPDHILQYYDVRKG